MTSLPAPVVGYEAETRRQPVPLHQTQRSRGSTNLISASTSRHRRRAADDLSPLLSGYRAPLVPTTTPTVLRMITRSKAKLRCLM
jgi:hypothetical protein